ncbi:centromere protein H isoform X1 [Erpetoichthys calabaricus]|uniref:centromere protein H isoform X1 n=2 Tax=Erpetoichthys calabaricus TaxID=27687 RepID=UPI00223401CE|nr:centromere protein H isoform X1 [Erpetoichthys calabaricus]
MAAAGSEPLGEAADCSAENTVDMDVFQKLNTASQKLGQAVKINYWTPADPTSNNEESYKYMFRLKQQLAKQCEDMKIRLKIDEDYNFLNPVSEAKPDITEALTELETAKNQHQKTTLALHRAQVACTISEKVVKEDKQTESIKETVNHTLRLYSQILNLQEEGNKLRSQVQEVRKKRLTLKKDALMNMVEIRKVSKMKEKKVQSMKSEVLKQGQEYLEKYLNIADLTENVFQGLILGSNVNWATDPHLREIVLQLEKNFSA